MHVPVFWEEINTIREIKRAWLGAHGGRYAAGEGGGGGRGRCDL